MRIDTRKEVNTSEKREDMVEEEFVKEQDYYENGKQMAACKI